MRLAHPAPFGPRWRGHWIWHRRPAIRAVTATRPELDGAVDTVALFRRTVELDAAPREAVCRIWVDGRYVLTVNGTEVARGPVRSDPARTLARPCPRPGPARPDTAKDSDRRMRAAVGPAVNIETGGSGKHDGCGRARKTDARAPGRAKGKRVAPAAPTGATAVVKAAVELLEPDELA